MPRNPVSPVQTAAGRLNATLRHHPDDPDAVADARNNLLAAHLERAIEDALDPEEGEPLRKADRRRLAKMLTRD